MFSFDKHIDQLALALESVEMETGALWPKERVVLDSYQALGGLRNGGLIAFWEADIQQGRVIRSFRCIGARRLADLIGDSKWARDLIRFGTFEKEQHLRFEKLEHELFEELETVLDLIRKYLDRNQLEVPTMGGREGFTPPSTRRLIGVLGLLMLSLGDFAVNDAKSIWRQRKPKNSDLSNSKQLQKSGE